MRAHDPAVAVRRRQGQVVQQRRLVQLAQVLLLLAEGVPDDAENQVEQHEEQVRGNRERVHAQRGVLHVPADDGPVREEASDDVERRAQHHLEVEVEALVEGRQRLLGGAEHDVPDHRRQEQRDEEDDEEVQQVQRGPRQRPHRQVEMPLEVNHLQRPQHHQQQRDAGDGEVRGEDIAELQNRHHRLPEFLDAALVRGEFPAVLRLGGDGGAGQTVASHRRHESLSLRLIGRSLVRQKVIRRGLCRVVVHVVPQKRRQRRALQRLVRDPHRDAHEL
mmetsp:Transcript_11694/g.50025  ORF Transcript_11694/g.50025 Transcript_11694/m.50025 type:complete len:276 (-) Transcript_11694:4595-5422(-)